MDYITLRKRQLISIFLCRVRYMGIYTIYFCGRVSALYRNEVDDIQRRQRYSCDVDKSWCMDCW